MTQPIKPVRTVEELMKPRVKCIANDTSGDFEVGEILYPDSDGFYYLYNDVGRWRLYPEQYPHLFRRLEWWEERSPEDMPEYVKYASTGKVYKAIKYKNGNSIVQIMDDFWKIPMWNQLGEPYWIPATEQDYTTQNP